MLGDIDHDVARYWSSERAFDVRHIPSPVYLSVEGERVPRQAVWMKAFGRLPDDPNQHRAALAYASDYSILEPVLRAHGVAWATPGLKVASLDHAMWWHRDARVDEWLLVRAGVAVRERRTRALPRAASTPATGCSWRAWRRRAWSAFPTHEASD